MNELDDDLEDVVIVTEKLTQQCNLPYIKNVAQQAAMTDDEVKIQVEKLGKGITEEAFKEVLIEKYKYFLNLNMN